MTCTPKQSTRATALEDLLHPMTAAQFFGEYWERRPLLVRGERGRFSHIFSSKDLGRLLHYLRPLPPDDMKLIKGVNHYSLNWINSDGSPRLDAVRDAWREGYTIIINALEKRWESVALLAASLHEQLHHPVDANLYYSPPQTHTSAPHFDVMDVFILQVEGSKVWDVHEPVIELPLHGEKTGVPEDSVPPLVMSEELREGDVLYLPRGYVHNPRTTSDASLHLTVGVGVMTWIDLFSAAVSAAGSDIRFRRALPPAFLDGPAGMREQFRGLLEELPGSLDLDGALGHLAERLLVEMTPPPGDEHPAADDELSADALLARRGGVICRALEGPGYAAIQYSGGKISGPQKIGAALRHIAQHQTFAIRDLPGGLSEQEKLVLARRLIRGGLLELRAGG
jgi:hypothetical protein